MGGRGVVVVVVKGWEGGSGCGEWVGRLRGVHNRHGDPRTGADDVGGEGEGRPSGGGHYPLKRRAVHHGVVPLLLLAHGGKDVPTTQHLLQHASTGWTSPRGPPTTRDPQPHRSHKGLGNTATGAVLHSAGESTPALHPSFLAMKNTHTNQRWQTGTSTTAERPLHSEPCLTNQAAGGRLEGHTRRRQDVNHARAPSTATTALVLRGKVVRTGCRNRGREGNETLRCQHVPQASRQPTTGSVR
jgi:hypothetical protein